MPKSKTNLPGNPELIVSKRTYKRLGTIVEHLTKNINPLYYEIKVNFTQNPDSAYVRIFPINPPINVIIYPVWEFVWTPYFNGKLVIHPNVLSPLADW